MSLFKTKKRPVELIRRGVSRLSGGRPMPRKSGFGRRNLFRQTYRSSDKTFCGFWLAIANTLVPDWTRI
ncbi:hypothetical protein Pan14r_28010 [Crateriforma conspicua]|uniref:Uncharacterized protein n=1 Tax=Crateriforma conspicua TaxID=2527996 RepID=A0A5C5Y8A3_9PLAN|nr:hypothetical protein Mal65_42670 [Crateriforma conspicua]TWT70495.1 hypothetical protein Pan14r_28010 [Crateriforma conspicua]